MARASLFQSESVSQILQCPLCLETLKTPRVIPCGHTYCTLCLQSHININLTNIGTLHVNFPCAICRANTVPSDPTVGADQWAESFPFNTMVVSLLNICTGIKGMKGCDLCLKKCKKASATFYCQDCNKSTCDTCKQYHDDFSVCKQENSFSYSEINEPDNCKVSPSLSFIEMCPKHPDERIKFICKDHDALCCNTCGFLQHRMCDNIKSLEDILQTIDVQIKSKEVETDLKKCNDHLKLITSRLCRNSDTMQNEKVTILQKVKSLIEQLSIKVMKFEIDLAVSIEGTQKLEQTILQSQKTEGSSLITSVDSDQIQLDLVMKQGSEVQKVIALHNLEQRHLMYHQTISDFQKRVHVVTLTLDVDKHFQKLLDSLNKLGEIKLTRKAIDLPQTRMQTIIPTESQFKLETAKEPSTQNKAANAMLHMSKRRYDSEKMPLWQRKVAMVKEFSARTGRDENVCHISDVIELHDSRLFLVDMRNCKVKMFGQDYVCQNGLRLPEFPWNACVISNTMVAVTVPHQRTIQIVQTGKGVNKLREIATRFMCWGIAYLKSQLVVTTGTDGNCILVLNLNGTELRYIGSDNYQRGQPSQPSCITTNRSKTAIYVTYQGDHRLVAYSLNWDILFTYTDQDMRGPGGVDTDREGNIYLCGYQSNTLQQITPDGKLIKMLLTGKPKFLRHRCCRNRDRLFLTYMKSAVVEVYHLQ